MSELLACLILLLVIVVLGVIVAGLRSEFVREQRICPDLGLPGIHFNRVIHRARERYRELYEKAAGLV